MSNMWVYVQRDEFLIGYMTPKDDSVVIIDDEYFVFPKAIFMAFVENNEVTVEISYNDCEKYEKGGES